MVLETPKLEIVNFIKETIDKLIGFWRVVLIEKYVPGGAKAGNSKFLKEFYQ